MTEETMAKIALYAISQDRQKLIERLEGMKEEEKAAKPADETEELYEWARLTTLDQVIAILKEGV